MDAPFSGVSIAEYFRDRGQHALIVIDDLSKHAATHRELALLTREPPGREAYPGDIFYLHARLLERAAKLSAELGGWFTHGLADRGNRCRQSVRLHSHQPDLDHRWPDHARRSAFRCQPAPAVDVGLSVSRVGGKAQLPALRKVSGRLRLDYSQFLELEMFTRFGGAMEPRSRCKWLAVSAFAP